MLDKASIKVFDDNGGLESRDLESPCSLCNIVYPMGASYSNEHRVPSKSTLAKRNEREDPTIGSNVYKDETEDSHQAWGTATEIETIQTIFQ